MSSAHVDFSEHYNIRHKTYLASSLHNIIKKNKLIEIQAAEGGSKTQQNAVADFLYTCLFFFHESISQHILETN